MQFFQIEARFFANPIITEPSILFASVPESSTLGEPAASRRKLLRWWWFAWNGSYQPHVCQNAESKTVSKGETRDLGWAGDDAD